MKKFFYATLCVVSLCLSGCGYDDDEVWNAINDQEERIAALEEWQKTANENIAALQAIVNGNDYITSVEEIKEGDEIIGYTINFHRQGEVTIYNGKDGEKGDMPVIGVSEGEDGRWYWTVNGELLEDADGNPVCANGKDGEDGEDGEDGSSGSNGSSAPIPQVKTENGEVYLSVDGGATWHKISGSNTTSGDSFIESVVDNESHYTFNLANGESIQVLKYAGLRLLYLEGNSEEGWSKEDIVNGQVEATADEDFTIQCYYSSEYRMSYKIVEGKNDWEVERFDFRGFTDLRFKGVSEVEPTTIIFSLVAADNSTTFYQVTLTVSEKEEEGEDTEQVAVIPETENSELVSVLENLGIGEKDVEGNLSLTQQDIDETTSLDLSNRNLNNLEGLEVFTNLTKLDCSNNQISELDLTKAPNLTSLNCSDNSLASLDVSVLPELIELRCDRCFSSSNSRSYSNGILDLSVCTKLQVLSCTNNGLTELILPETLILVDIYCSNNKLKRLDVSRYTSLSQIHCEFNQLTELKLPKTQTLKEVWCRENELTSLDVSGNIALERLTCNSNDLERLNVRTNTSLQVLECQENQLKALDISQNGMLTVLYVGFNSLSDIDVSMNKALEELSCEYNQLTKLDISPCKDLKELACSSNQLLTLDISQNTKLTYITCGYQHNIDEVEQMLSLVVNEAQKESWENDWVYYNEYVKIVSGAVNVSGGIGNNFEYGGVY